MTAAHHLAGHAASGFVSRGHRAIAPFVLSRPTTVAEAVARLAAGGHAHAGGIDLVERMQRGLEVAEVVDLGSVAGLDTIEVAGDRLRIGAAVTHARIESDPLIARVRPDLAAAWRTVGNVRIRRTGTVGGNLMAFDKNYDAAPILAAAGAELVFAGAAGVAGPTRTSVVTRSRTGLLTAIEIPLTGRVAFDRTLKPVVSVAVGSRREISASGSDPIAIIAIGCAHPELVTMDRPVGPPVQAAALVAASVSEPLDDADASSGYRRRMIGVLVHRCLDVLEVTP